MRRYKANLRIKQIKLESKELQAAERDRSVLSKHDYDQMGHNK